MRPVALDANVRNKFKFFLASKQSKYDINPNLTVLKCGHKNSSVCLRASA